MINNLDEYKAKRDDIFWRYEDDNYRLLNTELKKLDANTDPSVLSAYEEEARRAKEWKAQEREYLKEWYQDDGKFTDED